METLLQAALLGIVEGLTEFLPVSSTGHLILLVDMLGFQGPPGKVFEIAIQLGAILAVCFLYRAKLWNIARTLPHDRASQRFTLNLLLGFLPAAGLGALFHGFIKERLFTPQVVCISLILGGVAILLIERRRRAPTVEEADAITPLTALKIGLFQSVAMIPGVSRSGATIMGALLLGCSRKAAAEFSFFLAIPTLFAATVYDLYKNFGTLDGAGALTIATGFVFAFLSALLVVKALIAWVSRHGFTPFAWYRIALGSLMLLLLHS